MLVNSEVWPDEIIPHRMSVTMQLKPISLFVSKDV